MFPTIKHLEQLGAFASVAELLSYASGREVLPVQPKVGSTARSLACCCPASRATSNRASAPARLSSLR